MASIRQLNTKNWQVQIRRRGIKPVTKTFASKELATKWVNLIESEIDRGVYVNRDNAERVTLFELIERYKCEVTPLKRSANREISRLKNLEKCFGVFTLARLQAKDIGKYRDERLMQGLSGATVVKDLNTLSHIIDTAMKEWGCHIPYNPVRMIRKPRINKPRSRRLSASEMDNLLTACRGHSLMMASIVIFTVETGMRLGEMINLSWNDIDLDASVAVLNETKNGEMRVVALSKIARETLVRLPRHFLSKQVFWQWGTVSGFESSWQRVLKRSGVKDFRFHDLRHEATSRLFEKGLNVIEVSAMTGHKTLQMLKRYTHLKAENLVAKLG